MSRNGRCNLPYRRGAETQRKGDRRRPSLFSARIPSPNSSSRLDHRKSLAQIHYRIRHFPPPAACRGGFF